MQTRCNLHQHRETIPAGCTTCARIRLENDIVTLTVDTLLMQGYALRVATDDGFAPAEFTNDREAILAELQESDDEYLHVRTPSGRQKWVRFVYGNDGWDVICDYHLSLEAALAQVNAYVDGIAP